MVITIYDSYDSSYVILGSKNEEFIKAYGERYKIPSSAIYTQLSKISNYVNNELHDECIFEID